MESPLNIYIYKPRGFLVKCPKCKNDSVIPWYNAEDMVKKGIDAALIPQMNIFKHLFSVKEAIFGKKFTYKCAHCNEIFRFGQGYLFAPCAFCGERADTVSHGYCCDTLRCQKCYAKMYTYSQERITFECAACGEKFSDSVSPEEMEEVKGRLDKLRG